MPVSYAGDRLSAAQLTFIAGIGEEALNVTADTDSSSWNSSTKVLTNLVGTFTAVDDGIYDVDAFASVTSSGITYATLGIVFKQGGAAAGTDALCGGPATHRLGETGAVYAMALSGRFVATANSTYGVAVVGWIALGGATVNLDGGAHAVNRLRVTRSG